MKSEKIFGGEFFRHLEQEVVRFFSDADADVDRNVSDEDRKDQFEIRRKKSVGIDAELMDEKVLQQILSVCAHCEGSRHIAWKITLTK